MVGIEAHHRAAISRTTQAVSGLEAVATGTRVSVELALRVNGLDEKLVGTTVTARDRKRRSYNKTAVVSKISAQPNQHYLTVYLAFVIIDIHVILFALIENNFYEHVNFLHNLIALWDVITHHMVV